MDAMFNDVIDVKLETTRAICEKMVASGLTNLNAPARAIFSDIVNLFAVLMMKYAGEFPEDWSVEEAYLVYSQELPRVLTVLEMAEVAAILTAYLKIAGEALQLDNYLEISEKLCA